MATIASLLIDVHANTASLEREVKQIHGSLDSVGSAAKSMGGLLGTAFSVGAVLSFGKGLFDAAGNIQDVSDRLHISAETVQDWSAKVAAGGASIEDVGRALFTLEKNLGNSTQGFVTSLNRLGVSVAELKAASPEDRLRLVAEALMSIKDPADRAALSQALLGKTAANLAGVMGDLADKTAAVHTASKENIAAVDKEADALALLATSSYNAALDFAGLVVRGLAWRQELAAHTRGTQAHIEMMGKLANAARERLGMTGEEKGAIAALGFVQDKLTSAMAEAGAEEKRLIQIQKDAAEAAAKHTSEVHKLRDAFTGADAIAKAKLTIEGVNAALKQGVTVAEMSAESQKQINDSMGAAIDAYKRFGGVAPLTMRDLWFATIQLPPVVAGLGKEVEHLGAQFQMTIPQVTMDLYKMPPAILGIAGAFDEVGTRAQKMELPKVVEKVKDHIGELAQALSQLAQISGGTFGGIVRDLATFIAAIDTARKASLQMKAGLEEGGIAGMTKLASGALAAAAAIGQVTSTGNTAARTLKGAFAGAEAGAAFGPWGVAIGAVAGGLVGLIRGLGQGRDAVKDFAASFGGFDALRTRLLDLGAAGEQLWINLTQGVGRNNPAEARRAIDAINAALAGQDAWMQRLPGLIEKYGLSWEDAGIKAKQAHLDDIARGLIQEFADLSKAGFDVTLITEKMSTAVQDYVSQAIRTGTEIPAAMKPLLQKMVDLGILTDAAGVKLENLDSLTFATTLTEGFKGVIDAIHELTRVLAGDLKPALEDIGRTVVTPTIKPRMDTSDIPGGGGSDGGPESFLRASSNLLAFPAPAAAASFTPRAAGAGGGVRIGQIVINGANKDPREIAQEVSREIVRTQRYAQRLNRAS